MLGARLDEDREKGMEAWNTERGTDPEKGDLTEKNINLEVEED